MKIARLYYYQVPMAKQNISTKFTVKLAKLISIRSNIRCFSGQNVLFTIISYLCHGTGRLDVSKLQRVPYIIYA